MSEQAQQNATPKKRWPKWARAFLAALGERGNVRLACESESVQIDRSTAYRLRESDPTFAVAWDAALEQAADLLEEEARRRAHDGLLRIKFERGRPIMVPVVSTDGLVVKDKDGNPEMIPYVEREYSDTLMIFLLKGIRPEKYRERNETKHTFEPIDWDRVPQGVRDAFIEGTVSLDDVRRLISGIR
jgi:hypothetical protein